MKAALFFPALFLSLTTLNPGTVFADDAYVLDVVREKGSISQILVSSKIEGAFSEEILEALESGAPVTFTYFLKLIRNRSVIWNKTERELAIKRMVKYDTIKKQYLVWEKRAEDDGDIDFTAELLRIAQKGEAKPEKEDKSEPTNAEKDTPPNNDPATPASSGKRDDDYDVIDDINVLRNWMTHLESIDLGVEEGLPLDGVYYVRVRCEMKSIKLIPPFNYILFFLALWDFDTDWANSAPFMLNGPPPDTGTKSESKPANSQNN